MKGVRESFTVRPSPFAVFPFAFYHFATPSGASPKLKGGGCPRMAFATPSRPSPKPKASMGVHKRRRWVGGLERRSLLVTPCQPAGALWVSLKRRLNGIERRLLVIFETPVGVHRRRESSKEPHLGVHDPHSCGVQEPSIHRWVPTNHPPSTGGCPRTIHPQMGAHEPSSIHRWVSTNRHIHEPPQAPEGPSVPIHPHVGVRPRTWWVSTNERTWWVSADERKGGVLSRAVAHARPTFRR
jgi:hypothetical protein